MPGAYELNKMLWDGYYDKALERLYGEKKGWAAERFCGLVDSFAAKYGDGELYLFSAPGRTEIGGNHTDHNRGRVLAGSINLDVAAVASPSEDGVIRISSEGHNENVVDLNSLEPVAAERGNSNSLVRGMAAAFASRGLPIGRGFRAYTRSDVFTGSGLSSSAAYETLVGVMLDNLAGNGDTPMAEIAKMAQEAENRFFGKPSGLMDQMACAVGGLITIDFENPERPEVRKIDYDFASSGHALCITGPLGSHSDLGEEYAAVPREMRMVASFFGRDYLREIEPGAFYDALPRMYGRCPDRALLRAVHFFGDNRRVAGQVSALEKEDFGEFLSLVNESGRSSYMYLQNVCSGEFQALALALAESERLLGGRGAFRVHGGGFAGTIQAFVPFDMVEEYRSGMDRVFGEGSCHTLSIRPVGATLIT